MRTVRKGILVVVVVVVVVAAAIASLGSAPAMAHNDDCVVAVHVGGIQVHPACG